MDSSKNQKKPNININKKEDLTPGLSTLEKTPKPIFRASLLLPTKSSSTLIKKKPHYKIVPTEEAKPKKKINRNIGEQNMVTGKRVKKRL